MARVPVELGGQWASESRVGDLHPRHGCVGCRPIRHDGSRARGERRRREHGAVGLEPAPRHENGTAARPAGSRTRHPCTARRATPVPAAGVRPATSSRARRATERTVMDVSRLGGRLGFSDATTFGSTAAPAAGRWSTTTRPPPLIPTVSRRRQRVQRVAHARAAQVGYDRNTGGRAAGLGLSSAAASAHCGTGGGGPCASARCWR